MQALTTLSVSVMAWMYVGYGVFDHEGPAIAGFSNIMFSGFQDRSNLGYALSRLPVVCATTAIVGVGAAGMRTRALCMLMFVVAAVGVPVAARAAWNPYGMPPMLLAACALQ